MRERIARGNRPDHELAQRLARELNEMAATHEPLGLNDDQIRRFAAELCAGRTGDDILAEAAAERKP
jgi:broad specificity phosphatase PhoE